MSVEHFEENEDEFVTVHKDSIASMADSMRIISAFMSSLNEPGSLSRETIVILIHAKTRVSKKDINKVIDTLEDMDGLFLTQDDE